MQHSTGRLTIDLGAIKANYRLLAAAAPDAVTAAAVKADAYGLGMARVAPALAQAGCNFFYVAHIAEAVALRAQLPAADIAILHGARSEDAAEIAQHRLIPVLSDLGAVRGWHEAALRSGQRARVTIFLDTGMNRLGLGGRDAAALAANPGWLDGLDVSFWISHLACGDEPAHPMNDAQLATFNARLAALPRAPRSFANSAGIFLGPAHHFEQVRPGAALYGLNPIPVRLNPMRPVVTLTAPIIQLRDLLPGDSVGYGDGWRSKRLGKLAVLPVGYADGFCRAAGKPRTVWLGGHAAPVVGRVSMDLLTVDVTEVPDHLRQPGATVELIGTEHDADAAAAEAGTIGYEVLTNLGARYERDYQDI